MVLNPVVIDSRFFDTFKKILEIVLMILELFDDDQGTITENNLDTLILKMKKTKDDYPGLKKDVLKAVGFSDMIIDIKPEKSSNIISPDSSHKFPFKPDNN